MQRFVENPFVTASGHKADSRYYIVVAAASSTALSVWFSREGLLRVAGTVYDSNKHCDHSVFTSDHWYKGSSTVPASQGMWPQIEQEQQANLWSQMKMNMNVLLNAAGWQVWNMTSQSLPLSLLLFVLSAAFSSTLLCIRHPIALISFILHPTTCLCYRSCFYSV